MNTNDINFVGPVVGGIDDAGFHCSGSRVGRLSETMQATHLPLELLPDASEV
jgi:hypothetical protein